MITIILALATIAAEPTAKREPSTTPSSTTAAQPVADAPEQRYCISESNTGSILVHKACRTRAEWQRHGVEFRR